MLNVDPPFAPVVRHGEYLPLDAYGAIGDGTTAALVGSDASIGWLCVPRFDSEPLFAAILDARRGGAFTVAVDELTESRQRYVPDTAVLVTELRTPTGVVRVTDALVLRAGADLSEDGPACRGELVRSVVVLHGDVRLRVALEPRGGATAESTADGLHVRAPRFSHLQLDLRASRHLDGLSSTHVLHAGERVDLVLSWAGRRRYRRFDVDELLAHTGDAWRAWARHIDYAGPAEPMVRRSAITLKLCDHNTSGAFVAAPTSSLPESIGGPRNWDYRYAWVRDAAFTVYALRRIGLGRDGEAFLGWVLDSCEAGDAPRVLYDLDRGQPDPERDDDELEGYRGSAPVRWGNGAADQRQHDVYGEMLDCAYLWARGGGVIEPDLWRQLSVLASAAGRVWREPDHGIWEVRTAGRPFTYSAALCQVALDRAARLVERSGLPGPGARWRAAAEKIRTAVLREAWDDTQQSLTEHLGGGGLDASLLSLPLRQVVRAGDPVMVATTDAIARRLGAGDGLVFRYDPEESPDGLPGHEGAFVLCSFWLVDNLAKQGRLDEAHELYASLCDRANPLGLLPEQIDPTTGEFLGNFPQAFSHIGVISSAVNLANGVR